MNISERVREPDFPWQRFVVPADGTISYGPDGYVVDPHAPAGRALNASIVPVSEVRSIPSLSLLGEPGIGKSRVMSEMFEASPGRKIFRNLGIYATDQHLVGDVFESEEFQEWLGSSDVLHLFLDGLDECLAHIRPAAALIADRLARYPVSRLRMRIASRSSDWPELLQTACVKLWGDQYRCLEMVPLRRIDVEGAAASSGIDPAVFIEAVRTRGAQPFASRPLTLRFLLNLYRERGALPNSPIELYEQGCVSLAAEISPSRRAAKEDGTISPRERVDVAALLAAVSVLERAAGFMIRPLSGFETAQQDVVETEAIVAAFRSLDKWRSLTAATCEETLKTALFSWKNDSTATWAHWTYAEFLAGRFLGQNLGAKQLTSLFMRRSHGGRLRAAPQVREAVAWASSFNREFRRVLIAEDPLALAQSTVAGLEDEGRRALVDSLLKAFNRGDALDVRAERPPRYELVAHSGLAAQIAPYIEDRSATLDARLAAVELAYQCDVAEVLPSLAARALDPAEDMRLREEAARALSLIKRPEAVPYLRALLEVPQAQDPLDQLRGAALRGLARAGHVGNDIWEHIVAPGRKSYFGSYAMFLSYELPNKLPELDVHRALEFARVQSVRPDRTAEIQFRGLVHKILRLAWERRTQDDTLRALAAVVWLRLKNYDSPLGRRGDEDDADLVVDTDGRRRLLVAVVDHAISTGADVRSIVTATFRLVDTGDFGWALTQATATVGPTSQVWAALARLSYGSTVEALETLHAAIGRNAAIDAELGGLVRAVELDSAEAKEARAQYARMKSLEEGAVGPKEPPFPDIARDLLDKFDAGNTAAYWHLNYALAAWVGPAGKGPGTEFESDLRAYEGWTTLDRGLQDRVRDAGLQYLAEGEPSTDEWIGTTTYHRPAAAGYRALALLQYEGDARLDAVPTAVWKKWAGIIVGYPADEEGVQLELGRRAYRAAPEDFRSALLRVAEREDREHGSVYILLRFRELVDPPLASTLFEWLKAERRKPGTLREVLAVVLPVVQGASEWAERIATDESRLKDVAPAAAEALIRFSTTRYWNVLWKALTRDDQVLAPVLARLVEGPQTKQEGGFLSGLSEDEIGELYQWLAKKCPVETDPDHDGAHWVSDDDRLRQLRNATLNHLKERGTAKAVDILATLAAGAGPRSWLRYLVFQAEEALLREKWGGLSASELVSLLSRSEARVVDSDDDLLAVVVEALGRLQSRVSGETPAAEDLWDKDRPKDELALSDYIKRFLADDLKARRVVVNREVEVTRGSRTDVRVEAATAKERTAAVTIEVKGCWHREVTTALRGQLVDQYLRESARRCGVYLVGWFVAARWAGTDARRAAVPTASRDELLHLLEAQAVAARVDGYSVEVVVIDATAVAKR